MTPRRPLSDRLRRDSPWLRFPIILRARGPSRATGHRCDCQVQRRSCGHRKSECATFPFSMNEPAPGRQSTKTDVWVATPAGTATNGMVRPAPQRQYGGIAKTAGGKGCQPEVRIPARPCRQKPLTDQKLDRFMQADASSTKTFNSGADQTFAQEMLQRRHAQHLLGQYLLGQQVLLFCILVFPRLQSFGL